MEDKQVINEFKKLLELAREKEINLDSALGKNEWAIKKILEERPFLFRLLQEKAYVPSVWRGNVNFKCSLSSSEEDDRNNVQKIKTAYADSKKGWLNALRSLISLGQGPGPSEKEHDVALLWEQEIKKYHSKYDAQLKELKEKGNQIIKNLEDIDKAFTESNVSSILLKIYEKYEENDFVYFCKCVNYYGSTKTLAASELQAIIDYYEKGKGKTSVEECVKLRIEEKIRVRDEARRLSAEERRVWKLCNACWKEENCPMAPRQECGAFSPKN